LLKKIKIGLAGTNLEIEKYLKGIKTTEHFDIIGTFDTSVEKNFEIFYSINPFYDFLDRADAIFFCGNQHLNYFQLIQICIKKGKDLLIEKIPEFSYAEWSVLQKLNHEARSVFFISNIKGNCCQFIASKSLAAKPNFVKSKINLQFGKPQSNSELKDIVKENIDIVVRCVQSNIKKVKINQFFVFNQKPEKPDEIKISILFENSTNAEIIINRMAEKKENTLTFYQLGKIIKTDFESFKIEEIRLNHSQNTSINLFNENQNNTNISPSFQKTEKNIIYFDVIQKDLVNFVDCFINRVSPLVSLDEAIEVNYVLQNIAYVYEEIFI